MNVGACGGNLYDEEGNATTSFSRKYPSFLWELLGILYIPSLCFRLDVLCFSIMRGSR